MIRSIIGKDTCIKLIDRAKNCKKDEALNEKIHPSRYDEMVKSQDVIQLMHLVRALFNIKNDRAKELRRMKSADNGRDVAAGSQRQETKEKQKR